MGPSPPAVPGGGGVDQPAFGRGPPKERLIAWGDQPHPPVGEAAPLPRAAPFFAVMDDRVPDHVSADAVGDDVSRACVPDSVIGPIVAGDDVGKEEAGDVLSGQHVDVGKYRGLGDGQKMTEDKHV
jgi:hypothetical protein